MKSRQRASAQDPMVQEARGVARNNKLPMLHQKRNDSDRMTCFNTLQLNGWPWLPCIEKHNRVLKRARLGVIYALPPRLRHWGKLSPPGVYEEKGGSSFVR